MRSFFNRPSWATTGEENPEPEFYRRSKQTFSDILAANRERRARQASGIDDSPNKEQRENKRRRVSKEPEPEAEPEHQREPQLEAAVSQPSVDGEETTAGKDSSLAPISIDAKRDDDPGDQEERNAVEHQTAVDPIPAPVENSNSAGIIIHDSPAPSQRSPQRDGASDHDLSSEAAQREANSRSSSPRSESPAESYDVNDSYKDFIVEILITSDIPNTKPLIVRRKASQSLKDVRLAWCSRQNFSDQMKSSVFLTWKGKRLFDVTTCRNLCVERRPSLDDTVDILLPENFSRIQMDAVTEELFAAKRRTQTQPPERGTTLPEPELEISQQESLIRINLKCPGFEDHKVKAKPNTRILRLMSSFRDARDISSERQIHLIFDGERLDPESCISDHDIADLDLVEVQLK